MTTKISHFLGKIPKEYNFLRWLPLLACSSGTIRMLPGGDIAGIGFEVGGDRQQTKEQSPFCSAYFLANYTTARA